MARTGMWCLAMWWAAGAASAQPVDEGLEGPPRPGVQAAPDEAPVPSVPPAPPVAAPPPPAPTIDPASLDVAGALFGTSFAVTAGGYVGAHACVGGSILFTLTSFTGPLSAVACCMPFVGLCGAGALGATMPPLQAILVDFVADELLEDDGPWWPSMLAGYGACIPLSLVGLFISGSAFLFSLTMLSAYSFAPSPPPLVPPAAWPALQSQLWVYWLAAAVAGHAMLATVVGTLASAVPVAVRAYDALDAPAVDGPDAPPPRARRRAALAY